MKDLKAQALLKQTQQGIISKYICGEQVAETAAWGIHKLDIDVYFDYDNNGDIHVLKMAMQPDKGVDIR